ncbi:MAG TPA: FumA C-terminus/TtdB family hydratase beta subunit [Acidobacteriota bacterium]|jgi:fumarate hydratase class I
MKAFEASLLSLITETSSNLPADVRAAMSAAMGRENPGTQSSQALAIIANNIDLAEKKEGPICQDTGMPTFEIHTPVGFNQLVLERQIRSAIAEASRQGKLRPNSVDSITGKNSGDNLGPGTPVMHFHQWEKPEEIEIRLLLKGGGCENKNIQYSLPAELPHLGRADRNLDGVRKCILHAVWQAQGQGCSAGALGVGIGGDRTSGYQLAKDQLFRSLEDTNPDAQLAALEQYIMRVANTLGIGTMGFGGGVTLIGCKIGSHNRLPASFFVSVAYDCWAFRRLGVVLDATSGEIRRWLYRDAAPPAMQTSEGFLITGREVKLTPPLDEQKIRNLKVGQVVLIEGEMFTGRDAVHSYLMKNTPPVDLKGSVLYHCGPVVMKENGGWKMTAAGPTTSIREEPYEADVIGRFGVRAVMGKGGMGKKTLQALQQHGAVYLNAIGGAAQYYARCIQKVKDVHLMEFGIPEAMWHIEVKDFPAIVTMDAGGNSLHADVEKASAAVLATLADPVF